MKASLFLGCLLVLLIHGIHAEEVPRKFLEFEDQQYFSVYDEEDKAGWSVWNDGPAEWNGQRAYRHYEYEERVGLYFGQEQTLVWEYEEFYSLEPPYRLLQMRETTQERGFTHEIVVRPIPGEDAYLASITEGENKREVTIPGDGTPYNLSDFWAIETYLGKAPKIGDRVESRLIDTSDLSMEKAWFVVLEELEDGGHRVALEAEPEGRYLTVDVSKDGHWERYSFVWGERYEPAESEEAAKADLGNYSFISVLEVPIDELLGEPSLLTEMVVRATGDWTPSLRKTHMQDFDYDPETDVTEIRVGENYGTPEKVTDEERDKALRATTAIPSDDEDIQKLAESIVEGAKTDWEKVERLSAYVSRTLDYQIDLDPLSISESLNQRRGDCSEHADLLAALGRSLGIPTRSTEGWVYMGDSYPMFGYHAWNEVAIDGEWVSLDSTWGELHLNATHVKMTISESDQSFGRKIRDGELAFELVHRKQDPKLRLKQLNELIAKYPEEATWMEQRGVLQSEMGNMRAAIRDLNQAIKLDGDVAEFHEMLASIYIDQRNPRQAARALKRATEISPLHPGYCYTRSWVSQWAGDTDGALEAINQALDLQPNHVDYLMQRAEIYMSLEKLEESLKDASLALKLSPGDAELHNLKGDILVRLDRYAEGEESFVAAIALDPSVPLYHTNLGIAKVWQGKNEEARKDLEKALELVDEDKRLEKTIRETLEGL